MSSRGNEPALLHGRSSGLDVLCSLAAIQITDDPDSGGPSEIPERPNTTEDTIGYNATFSPPVSSLMLNSSVYVAPKSDVKLPTPTFNPKLCPSTFGLELPTVERVDIPEVQLPPIYARLKNYHVVWTYRQCGVVPS